MGVDRDRLVETLTTAINKALGHDGKDGTYIHYLTRCKSAYGWGTMTLDDFTEVDDEFTGDIVSAVLPIVQAEIERLNGACCVLEEAVLQYGGYTAYNEAQKIKEGKEGKDGERG